MYKNIDRSENKLFNFKRNQKEKIKIVLKPKALNTLGWYEKQINKTVKISNGAMKCSSTVSHSQQKIR